MDQRRLVGHYGGAHPGPVLIVTAALHGNELAGLRALERTFSLLDEEPKRRPGFRFRGDLYGLAGNLQAIDKGVRYVESDMNRMWTPAQIERVRSTPRRFLRDERRELSELLEAIETILAAHPDVPIVVLDLHTTTADGGIFCIATEDPESIRIASELHAPVVLGMLTGIEGTTMHHFRRDRLGRDITCFVFEAGQHDDPLSIDRATAAIIATLRALELVQHEDVESHHDQILIDYARNLPGIVDLVQVYRIRQGAHFEMLPGFHNFQKVQRGQLLAYEDGHPIKAIDDGIILMPRYQPQGDDGFFILRVLVDM
jgi:succinylglutamate desuccinylase